MARLDFLFAFLNLRELAGGVDFTLLGAESSPDGIELRTNGLDDRRHLAFVLERERIHGGALRLGEAELVVESGPRSVAGGKALMLEHAVGRKADDASHQHRAEQKHERLLSRALHGVSCRVCVYRPNRKRITASLSSCNEGRTPVATGVDCELSIFS